MFSADKDFDSRYPTNVVVSSSGDCLWVPPGMRSAATHVARGLWVACGLLLHMLHVAWSLGDMQSVATHVARSVVSG